MRALLVLFLVIAAAGTFYFVTQSDTDPASPGLGLEGGSSAAPADVENGPDETVLAPVNPSVGERENQPASLPVPVDELSNATPEGQTAVVGTVENTEGKAVIGATVTLTRYGATTLFFADQEGVDRSGDRKAKTDDRGQFTFAKVKAGDAYALIVQHPDYSRREEGPFGVPDGEQVTQLVVVKPGTRLVGTITDTGGSPVPGANIQLSLAAMGLQTTMDDSDPTTEKTVTGSDGTYAFNNMAVGQYTLTVAADGYGRLTMQQLNITEDDEVNQDLVLEVASAMGGKITSSAGAPIEKAVVKVYSIANRGTRTQTQTLTEVDGTFLVDDIPDGEYSLRVEADGYKDEPWTRASAGDMNVAIQLSPKPKVRGRVVDALTGKPLTTFTVNLRQGLANSDMSTKVQGTTKEVTDSEGRFEVDAPLPGDYRVEAVAGGYAPSFSESFRIEEGQELPGITVNVDKGGSISGILVSSNGEPVSGAIVKTNNNHWTGTAFDLSMGEFFPGTATKTQTRSGSDGSFTISGLTPSTYLIEAEHKDHSKTVMKGIAVQVGQDTDIKELVMTSGASVAGTVRGPSGSPLMGATVTMQMEAGPEGFPITYNTKTGREGQYTFKHVRSGAYYIYAARPNQNQGNPFAGAMDVKQSRRKMVVTEKGDYQGEDFDLAN